MSVIYIKDLVVEAKHGVHQPEKTNAQRFKISVELTFDLSKAAASDELADTLNWSRLRDSIVEVAQNNSFNLVERLAQAVAERLMRDGRIQAVIVTIDKLDAFEIGVPGVRLMVKR